MQPDNATEIQQLKVAFTSIPAEVTVSKDAAIAGELIAQIAEILGAGPASRPAVHPRPVNAGLAWDELDEVSQHKYNAVLDCLDTEIDRSQLSSQQVTEALQVTRQGSLRLASLPQQGYSGMVQRTPTD